VLISLVNLVVINPETKRRDRVNIDGLVHIVMDMLFLTLVVVCGEAHPDTATYTAQEALRTLIFVGDTRTVNCRKARYEISSGAI